MRSLPEQLLNSLSELDHFNKEAFISSHNSENKITSIRLNPFKPCDLDFEMGAPVPWNKHAFYLNERPSFTLDPLFHAGCYYVQEAGSMFLEHALKQVVDLKQEVKIMDACAAPGGKSTLLNSLISPNSLLVSNEIIRSRAEILSQQMSKWGTCNSIVTNSDSAKFSRIENYFDVLVVDAPCSGSGLFRKQPEAIDEWSASNVQSCSIRQKKILMDLIPVLKEEGILFYSTCSYSVEENEDVMNWLVSEHDFELIKINIESDWGIVETEAGYRFYPHLTKSEGFFCAILRKKNGGENSIHRRNKKQQSVDKKDEQFFRNFVNIDDSVIVKRNEQNHLMNQEASFFLNETGKDLYFKKAGTVIGEIKGKDLVPNHEFALSLHVSDELSVVNVDRETALKFLRKEEFKSENSAKGFTLMQYKNFGIGWSKFLPNRINNYLPNEYRILK